MSANYPSAASRHWQEACFCDYCYFCVAMHTRVSTSSYCRGKKRNVEHFLARLGSKEKPTLDSDANLLCDNLIWKHDISVFIRDNRCFYLQFWSLVGKFNFLWSAYLLCHAKVFTLFHFSTFLHFKTTISCERPTQNGTDCFYFLKLKSFKIEQNWDFN